MSENTRQAPCATEEDEIDLRELFATIWDYKYFIFFLTLVITLITIVIAYRMPKYYKTTTTIEVKPRAGESSGISLGGAGALLGLAGITTPTSSIDKDAALLSMYRVNSHVLTTGLYQANFWHYNKFRYNELGENNCSIYISDLKIHDYKKFGMEVTFKPLSKNSFSLEMPSLLWNKNIGTFAYNTPIHTKYFDMTIHKNKQGAAPDKVILNADKHFIFNKIISKNLTAELDKKSKNPFIKISYLDTLPKRGEKYTKELIDKYINMSIKDELSDINISISSINTQIKETEELATKSQKQYQSYKSQNNILSAKAQAEVLIKEKAAVDSKINDIQRKMALVKKLISMSRLKSNIDTMAPSLTELGDTVTAQFVGKLQDLRAQKIALSQEFKPSYPKLIAINHQINDLRNKIRSSLKALQKILSGELSLLNKDKNKFITSFKKGSQLETGLSSLTRDYKLYETMYTYLLQKRSAAELKKAEAINRFRTIDPIYTNPAPAKPKKALIVIVAFITALILSIFLSFFREFLRGAKR